LFHFFETVFLIVFAKFSDRNRIWPKQNWSSARSGRLLAKWICSSFSLGFPQAIELGLKLFTSVFVVDAGREPKVIERQSAIGVSERVTLRLGFLSNESDG
jgi:hypothetical protein